MFNNLYYCRGESTQGDSPLKVRVLDKVVKQQKSRIRETLNILMCADNSTNNTMKHFYLILLNRPHWANSVIELPCLCVCLDVCLRHQVQFFPRPLIGPEVT